MDNIKKAIASDQIKINYEITIDEEYFIEKYPDWQEYNSKVRNELRERTLSFIFSQLPTPKNFI